MKRVLSIVILLPFLNGLSSSFLNAAVPQTIHFQGRLTNTDNSPITETQTMTFRFYALSTGGSPLYNETQSVLPDSQGIYNVFIGEFTPFGSLDFNQPLWLELEVAGTVFSPRYQLSASPYAMVASTANSVSWSNISAMPGGFADGIDNIGIAVEAEEDDSTVDPNVSRFDFVGAQFNATSNPPGEANISLNPSSVTLQGNIFNGPNQLIRLNGVGQIPTLDGSNLTNINAISINASAVGTTQIIDSTITVADMGPNSVGGAQIIDSAITLSDLNTANIDTHYVTTGTVQVVTGTKTITANWVNTAHPWADNEVTDSLTVGSGGNVNNAALDSSSVTLQGNTFNGNSQLVQLNGSGQLPSLDGSNLFNVTAAASSVGTTQIIDSTITVADMGPGSVGGLQIIDSTITLSDLDTSSIDAHYVTTATVQVINGTKTITANWVNTLHPWADNEVTDSITVGSGGNVNNAALDNSSVTLQGNTFNGNNQLVQLNGSGQLPTLDGSNLTNVTPTADSVGTTQIIDSTITVADMGPSSVGGLQIIDSTITLSDLDTASIDTHYVTTATVQVINGTKTVTADWVNTTHPWADNEVSDSISVGSGGSVNNAALDNSSVTLQGNAFNGNSQLVQLNGSGQLPTLDGSNLTNVTPTADSVGTTQIIDSTITVADMGPDSVGGLQIIDSTITLSDLDTASIDTHYVTTATVQVINGTKTITADWVNTTHPWADNEVSDSITVGSGGSVNNAALDNSSVTLQGNAFNANNQLVQLNGSGQLPTLDGSNLTNVTPTADSVGTTQIIDSTITVADMGSDSVGGLQIIDSTITLSDLDTSSIDAHYVTTATVQVINGTKTITADWVNTAHPWADNEVTDSITVGSGGNVNNAALDSSSVTLQGNTFNGNSQLVQLNGSGQLPALDGSNLFNITAAAASVGTTQIINSTIALVDLNLTDIDTHYVTTATVQVINGTKTITGNWVNTVHPWADNEVTDSITVGSGGNVNNAALDNSSVTLQGNAFNGNNQLVQLNGSGQLPTLDGSNLTNVTPTADSVGTTQIIDSTITVADMGSDSVGGLQIIDSTITLSDLDTSSIDAHYVTTATVQVINGTKTITSDWVNTAHPWADNEVSDSITIGSGGSVNNSALDNSSVTLQGNTFNGNSQLVQLNGSGQLPALDGSNLFNITAAAGICWYDPDY